MVQSNIKSRLSGKSSKNAEPKMVNRNSNKFRDARDKIILKKRIQTSDVRDRLVQKTKQTDARLKLNRIRQVVRNNVIPSLMGQSPQNRMHMATRINADSQTILNAGSLTRTFDVTTPNRNFSSPQKPASRYQTLRGNPNVFTITNDKMTVNILRQNRSFALQNKNSPRIAKKIVTKMVQPKSAAKLAVQKRIATGSQGLLKKPATRPFVPRGNAVPMVHAAPQVWNRPEPLSFSAPTQNMPFDTYEVAPRPIAGYPFASNPPIPRGRDSYQRSNIVEPFYESIYSRQPSQSYFRTPRHQYEEPRHYEPPQFYDEPRPYPMEDMRPARMQITTPNMDYQSRFYDDLDYGRLPAKRPYDLEEYIPATTKRPAPRQPSAMSRLDGPFQQQAAGHKIIVNNLHNVVTEADIKELFGNVGEVYSSRLVREGTAEIIFAHEVDAARSVKVYDRRQLDGQPMSVTRVFPNDRSFQDLPKKVAAFGNRTFVTNNLTGAGRPVVKSVLRAAGGRTNQPKVNRAFQGGSQKPDVAPDIGTIHHALFSGRNGTAAPSSIKRRNPHIRM